MIREGAVQGEFDVKRENTVFAFAIDRAAGGGPFPPCSSGGACA